MPKILCCDDEVAITELMRSILEKEGHEVVTATHGEDCLQEVAKSSPGLLLIDNHMPGLSGVEVVDKIRQSLSPVQLPVVMLSSIADEISIRTAKEHRINDYFVKPIKPIDLIRLVERYFFQLEEDKLSFLLANLKSRQYNFAADFEEILRKHELIGFPSTVEGVKVCVVAPKGKNPALLADDIDDAKGKIAVFSKIGEYWQTLWPAESNPIVEKVEVAVIRKQ